MLRRVFLACAVLGLLAWPAVGPAQSATRGLHADRFDVHLNLLPDGSLEVVETITFRFTGRSFREVERRVPIRRVDGLIDVQALMDGRVLPEGRNPGEARIRVGRRDLRVQWRFPATSDSTHRFTLRYRAMGAMRLEAAGARLDWHVLPTRHRYAISEGEVRWQIPQGAVSIGGPALEAEGWVWSRGGEDVWTARKSAIGVDETAILIDTIEPATLQMAPPQWQVDADRARQFAPAFVVAAAVILIMGAGIIAMMFLRYHRPKTDGGRPEPAARGSLPPALGTGLRGSRPSVSGRQLSATFFDLLSRGILTIEDTSQEGTKETRRTFDVVAPSDRSTAPRLRPHEQVVMDALWVDMKQGRLALTAARRRLTGAHRRFADAAYEEMRAGGLLDPERRWASRGMTGAGVVTALLGVAALAVFGILLPQFGDAALLVPGAIIVLGLAFIVTGQSFPILSAAGLTASLEWAARVRQIRDDVRAGRAEALADQWLPVAVGAGLGRHFATCGAAIAWLRAVPNPSSALAVILAGSHVTAAGGGAPVSGGGVAGGGGFSGAR